MTMNDGHNAVLILSEHLPIHSDDVAADILHGNLCLMIGEVLTRHDVPDLFAALIKRRTSPSRSAGFSHTQI